MFGFRRRRARQAAIGRLHGAVVAASREPSLYGPAGLPDTVEGRFESLALHVLVTLRRLRRLRPPAGEVAQELIDAVFAHLEVALRESGIGDMGVPKRMKKLGRALYDRLAAYEPALDAGAVAVSAELARRLAAEPGRFGGVAAALAATEDRLAADDLDRLLAGPSFATTARNREMLP